ncbi:MAG TPA: hypothetical protein VLF93_02255 [Candidatus Saccharimonadales bacterium]|nr:hypothetical protein [Candidatus Saccharimonadales bacterium]
MSEYPRRGPTRGPDALVGNFETLVTLTRHTDAPKGATDWQQGRRRGLTSLAKTILRAPQRNLGPIQQGFDELDPTIKGAVHEVFIGAAVGIINRKGVVGRHLAGRMLEERAARRG